MAADLNVHWALRPDGQPKLYVQVLLTMRRIGAEGFGLEELAWNDRAATLLRRQLWAALANIRLAAHGHAARIKHRSHASASDVLARQDKGKLQSRSGRSALLTEQALGSRSLLTSNT